MPWIDDDGRRAGDRRRVPPGRMGGSLIELPYDGAAKSDQTQQLAPTTLHLRHATPQWRVRWKPNDKRGA